jgi:hypothetical protein
MLRYLGEAAAGCTAVIPHAALEQPAAAAPSGACFSLCHAGRLTPERDPGPLLHGMRLFLERSAAPGDSCLRFVGLEDVGLARRVRECGLDATTELCGPRGYLETWAAIAASSVAVLVEAPCAEGIFLPSKVVDCAQTGRPLLALSPREGTVADLLAAHGGGLAVDCRSVPAVAAGIGELFAAWKDGTLEERFGSRGLARFFSPGSVVSGYAEIIGALGGGRRSR